MTTLLSDLPVICALFIFLCEGHLEYIEWLTFRYKVLASSCISSYLIKGMDYKYQIPFVLFCQSLLQSINSLWAYLSAISFSPNISLIFFISKCFLAWQRNQQVLFFFQYLWPVINNNFFPFWTMPFITKPNTLSAWLEQCAICLVPYSKLILFP